MKFAKKMWDKIRNLKVDRLFWLELAAFFLGLGFLGYIWAVKWALWILVILLVSRTRGFRWAKDQIEQRTGFNWTDTWNALLDQLKTQPKDVAKQTEPDKPTPEKEE